MSSPLTGPGFDRLPRSPSPEPTAPIATPWGFRGAAMVTRHPPAIEIAALLAHRPLWDLEPDVGASLRGERLGGGLNWTHYLPGPRLLLRPSHRKYTLRVRDLAGV